jgi:CcmD family protein
MAQPREAPPDDSGFHASSGGAEMQSGERLLVEAYAAIWLIVLVFVFVMWRRTRALEDRIESLADAIKAARSSAPKPVAKKIAASGEPTKRREPAPDTD